MTELTWPIMQKIMLYFHNRSSCSEEWFHEALNFYLDLNVGDVFVTGK